MRSRLDVAITIKKKPLKKVLEKIEENAKIPYCPYTHGTPVIPFTAKGFTAGGSPNFELIALLKDIIVFKRRINPITGQPLSLNDIGNALVPNQRLIQQIDKILEEEGYRRKDLLDYYGISQDLYRYLLQLNYQKKPRELTRVKIFLIFILNIVPYSIIVESFSEKSCSGLSDNGVYQDILNSFHQITTHFKPHEFGYTFHDNKKFFSIDSMNTTSSQICNTLKYSMWPQPTELANPYPICESLLYTNAQELKVMSTSFINTYRIFTMKQLRIRIPCY